MAPPMEFHEYLSRFPIALWPLVFPFYLLVPFGDFKCERTDRPVVPSRTTAELQDACSAFGLFVAFGFVVLLLVLFLRTRRDD